MTDIKDLLNDAMDAAGMEDDDLRAATAAIVMGESHGACGSETSYAHTSVARIREVFHRLDSYSDDQIDAAKRDPEQWFELVYGGNWGARNLGNDEPGDGYKFRGRGLIQLTGKSNYRRYGSKIGVDLVRYPDKANEPETAAKIVAAYMMDRYKGGGFDAAVHCVGNCTPDIYATKKRFYDEFVESGEFDAGEEPTQPSGVAQSLIGRIGDVLKGKLGLGAVLLAVILGACVAPVQPAVPDCFELFHDLGAHCANPSICVNPGYSYFSPNGAECP